MAPGSPFPSGRGLGIGVRLRQPPSDPAAVADLVGRVATLLIASTQTLGVAESSTGGLLGHWLTDRPGASRWFLGGVIAYHNRLKIELLHAPAALFTRSDTSAGGTVSAATARALALGARQRLRCDWAVAETGLAGVHPGRSRKPIGLSYVAVAGPGAAADDQPRVWAGRAPIRGRPQCQQSRGGPRRPPPPASSAGRGHWLVEQAGLIGVVGEVVRRNPLAPQDTGERAVPMYRVDHPRLRLLDITE